MKARFEILERALVPDLKLLLGLGILHHDEAPVLPVASARRADSGFEDFADEFVGNRVRLQPAHRARRADRVKQADFPIHLKVILSYQAMIFARLAGR